jgi:hypothetical protein
MVENQLSVDSMSNMQFQTKRYQTELRAKIGTSAQEMELRTSPGPMMRNESQMERIESEGSNDLRKPCLEMF